MEALDRAIKACDAGEIQQELTVKTSTINSGKIMIDVENHYWDSSYRAFWDGKKLTSLGGDSEAKRVEAVLKAFGYSTSNLKSGINMTKKLKGLW